METLLRWIILSVISCFLVVEVYSQRDDIPLQKEKKAHSKQSILDMKDGVLILRLKTNHRKISFLQQNVRSSRLTLKQRERYRKILEGTLRRRDLFNQALSKIVLDSFSFCPVYLVYDTSTTSLRRGLRHNIFLDSTLKLDTSLTIEINKPVFLVNFQDKNSQFPFDVLLVQRLSEKLTEPFPYFVEVRESWINDINTPGAVRAVSRLDRKLWKYYERVMR